MGKAPSERHAPTSPTSGGGRTTARTKRQAKTLRKNLTEAEWQLWHKLKQRQVLNLHFRKQHPIGSYIVDFACVSLKIIIEVDGDSHYTSDGQAHDEKRTAYLNNLGWTIYRYTNTQIYKEIESVLDDLYLKLKPLAGGPPPPAGEVGA